MKLLGLSVALTCCSILAGCSSSKSEVLDLKIDQKTVNVEVVYQSMGNNLRLDVRDTLTGEVFKNVVPALSCSRSSNFPVGTKITTMKRSYQFETLKGLEVENEFPQLYNQICLGDLYE